VQVATTIQRQTFVTAFRFNFNQANIHISTPSHIKKERKKEALDTKGHLNNLPFQSKTIKQTKCTVNPPFWLLSISTPSTHPSTCTPL
jgi:hypothetical protein